MPSGAPLLYQMALRAHGEHACLICGAGLFRDGIRQLHLNDSGTRFNRLTRPHSSLHHYTGPIMNFHSYTKTPPFIAKPPSAQPKSKSKDATNLVVVIFPARRADGTKGFLSRTQIAPGGRGYASVTMDRSLITHIQVMSTICAKDREEAISMAVMPDAWGGSLEDEEIARGCMLVSTDEVWFRATTTEGLRLETLRQRIDVVLSTVNDGMPYVTLA